MGEPQPQNEEEYQPTPKAEGRDWKIHTFNRED